VLLSLLLQIKDDQVRDCIPIHSALLWDRVPDAESVQSCDSLGVCSVYVWIGFAIPVSIDSRWNPY